MRLFYYMGPKYLRDNLQKRRVKVSRYGKYGLLNDPFELAPYDISDRRFREVHKDIIDKFAQKMGLICLSETPHSPAMWAHYAENHTGACLEFEVTYDHVFKVKYESKKLFPRISDKTFSQYINRKNIKEIFGTKSKDWEYEKEHRMHVPIDNETVVEDGNNYFMPFQKKKGNTFLLKSVLVGYKFELGISKLEEALKEYRHKVKVIQTRPAFGEFKVVQQKNRKFWNMQPGNGDSLPAVRAVFGDAKRN